VQRQLGHQVEHDIDVRQPQVGVEHEDALALARQRGGEVGSDEGLADPALAARDRGEDGTRRGLAVGHSKSRN
jgi:hypothetical protein